MGVTKRQAKSTAYFDACQAIDYMQGSGRLFRDDLSDDDNEKIARALDEIADSLHRRAQRLGFRMAEEQER
jgi:hypothetical protein